MKKAIIIGAGFSGLATAASLAQKGFSVSVYEKHAIAGGRARYFEEDGFRFDMGPSWYWMPDVFERFFNRFGKKTSDFYDLKRLDPSYRVFWSKSDVDDIPADENALYDLFGRFEDGADERLQKFLKEAAVKYDIGINDLVYKPGFSPLEYFDLRVAKFALRYQIFQSFEKHISRHFSDRRIRQLLEFPILFLGGTAKTTPALYSLMNYADMILGTWYPEGGMYKVVEGMQKLCESLGVEFHFKRDVKSIITDNGSAIGIETESNSVYADFIVSSADYEFTERKLLRKEHRNYSLKYWESRSMSPSSMIYYLGVNKKMKNILHHNLFFDEDFAKHASEIYDQPAWPEKPSIYISCPSKSDPSVAPEGHENLMVLIPVAPGLQDDDRVRNHYLNLFIKRYEELTSEKIGEHIVYKRSYSLNDFTADYNAFKGNAYGLANTLKQTAIFKPGLRNKKLRNLFYTGQLTAPGPGVPPALISGQIVADEIIKQVNSKVYETVV